MEFFTTAAGITVHLLDTQEKIDSQQKEKTILLLHGYLETLNVWNELVERLKEKYRVIVIDMPGHGLTDSAPTGADGRCVNTMDFCADVVKSLMDKLNIEKAVIGGHSMGGYVAGVFCKKYPERAEKIIIFNSNPYADNPEKVTDRKREIDIIHNGKLQSLSALCIPKMFMENNLRKFDDKVMETIELCDMHNPDGIIACIIGMQERYDLQDIYENPAVPILCFEGDNDRFMDIEAVRRMIEKFPKIRHCLLENTGHCSFIEAEDKVYEQICEFIG